jgi:hypothetical protein
MGVQEQHPVSLQAILCSHSLIMAGLGSLRQPKPLSPSDIHSILEQEQEAMVGQSTTPLSRELNLTKF